MQQAATTGGIASRLAWTRLALAELRGDNLQLTKSMRETHELCEKYNDVATASLIEVWIDEAERRTWFLYEASRHGEP